MAVIPEMQGYFNSSKLMNVIHCVTKRKKKKNHLIISIAADWSFAFLYIHLNLSFFIFLKKEGEQNIKKGKLHNLKTLLKVVCP